MHKLNATREMIVPQTNIVIIMVFASMLLVTEMEIVVETRPAEAHPTV